MEKVWIYIDGNFQELAKDDPSLDFTNPFADELGKVLVRQASGGNRSTPYGATLEECREVANRAPLREIARYEARVAALKKHLV